MAKIRIWRLLVLVDIGEQAHMLDFTGILYIVNT